MGAGKLRPTSLVWTTDIDVLSLTTEVARRDGYWVVRSPANPGHLMGKPLLFDHPPTVGDRDRWLVLFPAELPDWDTRAFGWDVMDATVGAAATELAIFARVRDVGLVATPNQIKAHPRNRYVGLVRALSVDDPGWAGVLEL